LVGDVISSVKAQTSAGTFSQRRLNDPAESATTEDFQIRVL
jgi:hypothetical protein